jgi:hypothetical protein
VTELTMSIEYPKDLEFSVRYDEEIILILLFRQIVIRVQCFKSSALLALELDILLSQDPPVSDGIDKMFQDSCLRVSLHNEPLLLRFEYCFIVEE